MGGWGVGGVAGERLYAPLAPASPPLAPLPCRGPPPPPPPPAPTPPPASPFPDLCCGKHAVLQIAGPRRAGGATSGRGRARRRKKRFSSGRHRRTGTSAGAAAATQGAGIQRKRGHRAAARQRNKRARGKEGKGLAGMRCDSRARSTQGGLQSAARRGGWWGGEDEEGPERCKRRRVLGCLHVRCGGPGNKGASPAASQGVHWGADRGAAGGRGGRAHECARAHPPIKSCVHSVKCRGH